MKYCQGNKCHQYRTKDRIRGTKGDKSYQTRRRSSFYYGNGNFCCQSCMYDWINEHIEHALDHFGRTTEPKKVLCAIRLGIKIILGEVVATIIIS